MNSLLTHARDRREAPAYRASLKPEHDILELRKDQIVDDGFEFSPVALYGWFGVAMCYCGLALLALSIWAFIACVAVACVFFAFALSYPARA